MGWLVSFLIALLIVSLLAFAMPSLFGTLVAGVAPILVGIAIIGLGAVWWRRSQGRIDATSGQPTADADEEEVEDVRGEDEGVET